MKVRTMLGLVSALFLPILLLAQEKVILDTDPSYDPDDVGCMAMLHTMAGRGECEILAIINSTEHQESSLSISSINHFYNRPSIPVGDYKGYPEKINAPQLTYDQQIAKEYPRALAQWEDAVDGVKLYREILASAANRSITVVIIGTMHNFYGLLQSSAGAYSQLSGVDLVKAKVKQVVTMGGNFIDGKGLDRTNWGGADALCAYTDWSCLNEERNRMCRYVIENCPAPFVASGWEVGCGDYHDANYGNVMTGQSLKDLDARHIVRRSYEYHFQQRGGDEDISRHSNDQCALHYAIRGEGENYVAQLGGKINLSEAGVCTWEASAEGHQGYIQKKRDKNLIAKEIDELMMGAVPELDNSPPTSPQNLGFHKRGGKIYLHWDPAFDETAGSWVVAYHIYYGKKRVGIAYGTQFPVPKKYKKPEKFVVKSVNVAGMESD
ncbi:MAG: hypothetical protein HRU41_33320 [Saprospiraceae bacterium]|nr:hypothetical protein [Saprospiraceae bacterium]